MPSRTGDSRPALRAGGSVPTALAAGDGSVPGPRDILGTSPPGGNPRCHHGRATAAHVGTQPRVGTEGAHRPPQRCIGHRAAGAPATVATHRPSRGRPRASSIRRQRLLSCCGKRYRFAASGVHSRVAALACHGRITVVPLNRPTSTSTQRGFTTAIIVVCVIGASRNDPVRHAG